MKLNDLWPTFQGNELPATFWETESMMIGLKRKSLGTFTIALSDESVRTYAPQLEWAC
jgi:hypothetical protein